MVVHYSASDLPTGDRRWAEIGNWYDGLASARTEGPREIDDKAREVAGSAVDFKGRIRSVAGFMQHEIRYVAIEIGIGGLQPHPAAEVFKYRYGDCKDKATLLIAMLNAVGVRATYVLVDTHRGFVDPALPSRDGNHMIAAIEMPPGLSDPDLRAVVTAHTGKRYLIFDPTDTYTPIGVIRPQLQGSYGVLVAGNDSQVIELPGALARRLDARSHSVVQPGCGWHPEGHGDRDALGRQRNPLPLSLQRRDREGAARVHGTPAAARSGELYPGLLCCPEHARHVEERGDRFFAHCQPLCQAAGDLLLLRPRVIGSNAERFDDKPRAYPIYLGRTGTWRDRFDLKLPSGYVVDDMPEPVTVDVGFASYKSEVKATDGVLHYSREYTVRELDLAPEKYADLRKLMGAITADENNSAVLKKM